jgi:hypothetical protein
MVQCGRILERFIIPLSLKYPVTTGNCRARCEWRCRAKGTTIRWVQENGVSKVSLPSHETEFEFGLMVFTFCPIDSHNRHGRHNPTKHLQAGLPSRRTFKVRPFYALRKLVRVCPVRTSEAFLNDLDKSVRRHRR